MTPSAEQIRRRAIFRWGIRWALAAWLVGSFLILPGTALLAGRVLPQPAMLFATGAALVLATVVALLVVVVLGRRLGGRLSHARRRELAAGPRVDRFAPRQRHGAGVMAIGAALLVSGMVTAPGALPYVIGAPSSSAIPWLAFTASALVLGLTGLITGAWLVSVGLGVPGSIVRLIEAGRLEAARAALQRSSGRTSPCTVENALAAIDLHAGDPESAEARCRSLLRVARSPRFTFPVLYHLAEALLRQGRLDEARAVLDDALHVSPDALSALALLAELDLTAGTADDETTEVLDAALELAARSFRPTDVSTLSAVLARIRIDQGVPAEARALLADIDPDATTGNVARAILHRHLALAAEALGEPDQARAHWQAIVDRAPELAIAAEGAGRLA